MLGTYIEYDQDNIVLFDGAEPILKAEPPYPPPAHGLLVMREANRITRYDRCLFLKIFNIFYQITTIVFCFLFLYCREGEEDKVKGKGATVKAGPKKKIHHAKKAPVLSSHPITPHSSPLLPSLPSSSSPSSSREAARSESLPFFTLPDSERFGKK